MDMQSIIDRILDTQGLVGCEVLYPYIVVLQPFNRTPWTPEEIVEALNIDPALCVRNVNGNIRITCE